MSQHLWRIELLGRLQADGLNRSIVRFRTHKTGLLLAYLAYYSTRNHPREELMDLLWPESDTEAARTNLRVALSSLRRQLEPPGVPSGGVLLTDYANVGLRLAAIHTDACDFMSAIRSASAAHDSFDRIRLLSRAVELYNGELLPGFYEEWVLGERRRLADAYLVAVQELVTLLEQAGDIGTAIDYAHLAVRTDPLQEDSHCALMRLYACAGQPSAAHSHYRELERLLDEQLGVAPAPKTRELLAALSQDSVSAPRHRRLAGVPAPDPPVPEPPRSYILARVAPGRDERPSWLPLSFTRFFGRDEEIDRLMEILAPATERWDDREFTGVRNMRCSRSGGSVRLLTLTGFGGSGKTRLALEMARRIREAGQDAVFFVPLAEILDPQLIPAAIADILRLHRAPDVEPFAQIVYYLSGQPASMLVLDNFEHVAEEGGGIVRRLLEQVPSLTCLVTSRRHLGLECERVFPVLPLPVPAWPGTPERLMEFPSVQLFVDRAQAARPDFQVTDRNAPSVAGICEKLEGIPLALELAAAWSLTLTPAQMLNRLERRFDLLSSRRSDISPRHRTLRAAIEWSYRLLTPDLQRFFAALSVFRGGWTLEAAEAVCRQEGTLDRLTQLRERSLIVADETEEEMRYGFLESLREFAAEQLNTDQHAVLARRHAVFYLRLAEECEPYFYGQDMLQGILRLEPERDNMRAVLSWCADTCQRTRTDADAPSVAEIGLRAAASLTPFWSARAHSPEARPVLERLLQANDTVPERVRSRAVLAAGICEEYHGDSVLALERFEESLALSRKIGDRETAFRALQCVSSTLERSGTNYVRGMELLEQELALCRAENNELRAAAVAKLLASCCLWRGEYDRANALLDEYAGLVREQGGANHTTYLFVRGHLALLQKDTERAWEAFDECLSISRGYRNKPGILTALWNLSLVAQDRADYATARTLLVESLALARELGTQEMTAGSMMNLAAVLRLEGNLAEAERQYRDSAKIYQDIGSLPGIPWALEGLGKLAALAGHCKRAARLFGAAEALRERIARPLAPNSQEDYDRHIALLRMAMVPEAFAASWNEGRALSLDQAVEEAMHVS